MKFLRKERLLDRIQDESKNWTVKGFIDRDKNIYEITSDTKLISKILEIQILPFILKFGKEYKYEVKLPKHQNTYPDFTLIDLELNQKIALDLKTSYKEKGKLKGFTLGSHGTYFRDRNSTKNIMYPYKEYAGHFILGLIYERVEKSDIDVKVYSIDDLEKIVSSIKNIEIFLCEKWQVASDKQGSSNTANIGSIKDLEKLKNCEGIFTIFGEEGEEIFDDYWINYGIINPKTKEKIKNVKEFLEYKNRNDLIDILKKSSGENDEDTNSTN
ncbi:MAG: restriction endonuclease [Aquificae bacterium]|nr:restriction endonuclease [Aquificota bacterium]